VGGDVVVIGGKRRDSAPGWGGAPEAEEEEEDSMTKRSDGKAWLPLQVLVASSFRLQASGLIH
jgi:hypothetical protein